jgi:hypothetical protein
MNECVYMCHTAASRWRRKGAGAGLRGAPNNGASGPERSDTQHCWGPLPICQLWISIDVPTHLSTLTITPPAAIVSPAPRRRNSGLAAVQYLLTAIFIIDIGLSFFVSYYDKGVLVTSRATIVKNYLRWRCVWVWVCVWVVCGCGCVFGWCVGVGVCSGGVCVCLGGVCGCLFGWCVWVWCGGGRGA